MDIPPGIYKHFKGGRYSLVTLAQHSETKEPLVVYVSLKTGRVWARPVAMWTEEVVWPDGITRTRFIHEDPTDIRASLSDNLADPMKPKP
jgi:hypothetical protein